MKQGRETRDSYIAEQIDEVLDGSCINLIKFAELGKILKMLTL